MPADSFLSRWSKRKQESRNDGAKPAEAMTEVPGRSALVAPPVAVQPAEKVPEPAVGAERADGAGTEAQASGEELPAVESLTPESDFRPFMKSDVDPSLRNQAMKSLFRDPHFNVMDGLDVYIDDYSLPDPIPESMLRQMTQSKLLKLFDDPAEEKDAETQASVDSAQRAEAAPQDAAADAEARAKLAAERAAPAPRSELGQNGPDKTNCPTDADVVESQPQQSTMK